MTPFKLFLLFLIISSTGTALTSQTKPDNGMLWEDVEYDETPRLKYYPINEKGGDLPELIDLTPYCMAPGNQENIGRCVGDALAHALSIVTALKCGYSNDSNNLPAFSASYIFNQIKLDPRCKKGSYLSHGLKLLKTQGGGLLSDFPNTPNSCKKRPTEKQKIKAAPYRIKHYEALFKSDAMYKEKLDQIRVSLAMKRPVIVGMYVPPNLKREYPLKVKDPWDIGKPKSGHALVVVGYDEENEEFELINSYGLEWGNKGFFKLSYKELIDNVRYAYWMEL